jgi:hypothetical protein
VFRPAASAKIIPGAHIILQEKMLELRMVEGNSEFDFVERDTR